MTPFSSFTSSKRYYFFFVFVPLLCFLDYVLTLPLKSWTTDCSMTWSCESNLTLLWTKMSIRPSLLANLVKVEMPYALVKMSATCELLATWKVLIFPSWIFSLTKWQSTSICFVLSWNIGLVAICNTTWLSQKTIAGLGW